MHYSGELAAISAAIVWAGCDLDLQPIQPPIFSNAVEHSKRCDRLNDDGGRYSFSTSRYTCVH